MADIQAIRKAFNAIDYGLLIQAVKDCGVEHDLLDMINSIELQKFRESSCPKGGKHEITREQLGPTGDPMPSSANPVEYYSCQKCNESYWVKYFD